MIKQKIFEIFTRVRVGISKQTILIASVGRSGTTWLGNILSSLNGYKLLNEPLRPDDPSSHEARHRHRPYVDPNEPAPAIRQMLEDAFTGQVFASHKWDFKSDGRFGMLFEHLFNQSVVVKSTRSLRILPWIHRNFDLKGTVILVRHPCAVISSMLRSGGWGYDQLLEEDISPFKQAVGHQAPDYLADRFKPAIEDAVTNAEILAHMWALDYQIALQHHQQTEGQFTHLMTYEEMLIQGQSSIEALCTYLGEKPNEEMMAQLNQASRTASSQFSPENTLEQLQKWKRHLSDETIKAILSVTQMYDIGVYGTDVMPSSYQ